MHIDHCLCHNLSFSWLPNHFIFLLTHRTHRLLPRRNKWKFLPTNTYWSQSKHPMDTQQSIWLRGSGVQVPPAGMVFISSWFKYSLHTILFPRCYLFKEINVLCLCYFLYVSTVLRGFLNYIKQIFLLIKCFSLEKIYWTSAIWETLARNSRNTSKQV